MQYVIDGGDAFPVLKVNLDTGEKIKAEWNALVAMSAELKLTGKMDGGFGKALMRGFSGESFFLQYYEAEKKPGWVWLSAKVPGGVTAIDMDGTHDLLVHRNGFLAGSEQLQVSTTMQNLSRGFFSGEGFFIVRVKGAGTAFISSFGAIKTLELADGEQVYVDFGHLVAWSDGVQYDVGVPAKGIWSALTTGQVLGCKFTGPGRVYVQTLSPYEFGAYAAPLVAPYFRKGG